MEVPSASDRPLTPPVVLRYVYPGVTPKNGRVVVVREEECSGGEGEGEGGSTARTRVVTGAEVTALLSRDGVDTSRWALRYYHKAHEGWVRLEPDTRVAFTPPDQTRLELALEPVHVPTASSNGGRGEGGRGGRVNDGERDGYFGIGIYGGKNEANQGTLWRSAWQLGAAFIFTVGARFEKSSADTTKTWTTLPAYTYLDWGGFAAAQPFSAAWIAVEMGGTPLEKFEHPDRAVYVLGGEDNGLPSSVLRACAHHVSLPAQESRTASFNVAVTGSLILYDRLTKRKRGTARKTGPGLGLGLGSTTEKVDGDGNGDGDGATGAPHRDRGKSAQPLDAGGSRAAGAAGAAVDSVGRGGVGGLGQGDSLPGGRPGVDSAKPSQVLNRRRGQ